MKLTAYARRNDLLVSFEEGEMADAEPMSVEDWGMPLSSELFWVKRLDGSPDADCEEMFFGSMVCGSPIEMVHLLCANKTAMPDVDKDAILPILPSLSEDKTFCIVNCLPDHASRGAQRKASGDRPGWMTDAVFDFVVRKLLRIPKTVELKILGDRVPEEDRLPAARASA